MNEPSRLAIPGSFNESLQVYNKHVANIRHLLIILSILVSI